MRVQVCWFGLELDFYFGETRVDDEYQETCCREQHSGSFTSTPVGFTANLEPDWEKPLNRWDEPSEGQEDT